MVKRINIVSKLADKLDKQSIRMLLFTLATIFMLLAVSAFPLAIMAFLGMMPSLVVLILEAKSSMNLFRTILPLNVLGVSWIYSDIISQIMNSSITISDTVGNSNYWLIIFGTVIFGLFLYFTMPSIIYSWTHFKFASEIKLLHHRREKLREIWGPELVIKFVERVGAGSEVIDFLLRNGLMKDLEGNISFTNEDIIEVKKSGNLQKAEPAEVIIAPNGVEPIDSGFIENGFSVKKSTVNDIVSPVDGIEEISLDEK